MSKSIEQFNQLPGRILLDTCILNVLFEEGAYIWDNELSNGVIIEDVDPDIKALNAIFKVNERASFQFVVSPLTIAEVANVQDFLDRERRVRWILDVIDHWLIMLDEIGDRFKEGGSVRHRFKLNPDEQKLETELLKISDFRRDPFDRLLMIQYIMGNCDAFLTIDRNTIWKHREKLSDLGIKVLTPLGFWELLKPWAALWL